MIYMKSGEQSLLILEPSNIEKLKNGEPMHTPDNEVLVAYCPDVEWFAGEFMKIMDGRYVDAGEFEALLKKGMRRPAIYRGDDKMKRVF